MEFKITKKPIDIDTNSRVLYLAMMILFIIYYTGTGKDKTLSLLKLHLLLWAVKNVEKQQKLLTSMHEDCTKSIGFWNIDIKNNAILTILLKDKLCAFNGSKYHLTEDGTALIKNIVGMDMFKMEQDFLKQIGKKLTDDKVAKLKNLWS